jgi:hypothetical protein
MSIARYRSRGRVAVAILRFQLDSCEKKTAKERLNRGWTRIYADERQEPRMHTNAPASARPTARQAAKKIP